MPLFQLNPLTLRKIRRFQSIRRGWWSLVLFALMVVGSLGAELLINDRALVVRYEGRLHFPIYGDPLPGTTFGLDYAYETDYRDLARRLAVRGDGNWVWMPPIPYGPYSTDLRSDAFPPFAPSWRERHLFGTDTVGRDVLARLVYGFRIAIFFSLGLLVINYAIGTSLGCAMGYFGGRFDLFFQRLIEIWSNVPFLYVIIIISSVVVPSFWMLVTIMAIFGWIGVTWTMRTVTYKERERDYVLAARVLGASDARIILRHILPNTVAVIVTYMPFSVSSGIVALTSLDYLGFGLPPPTPSWGELLAQGWAYMSAWWIVAAVVGAMVVTLVAVTFIGEAVREALDPKLYTVYE
jgi:microcin C transport system permease protein